MDVIYARILLPLANDVLGEDLAGKRGVVAGYYETILWIIYIYLMLLIIYRYFPLLILFLFIHKDGANVTLNVTLSVACGGLTVLTCLELQGITESREETRPSG